MDQIMIPITKAHRFKNDFFKNREPFTFSKNDFKIFILSSFLINKLIILLFDRLNLIFKDLYFFIIFINSCQGCCPNKNTAV
jgi:hypothetical protein